MIGPFRPGLELPAPGEWVLVFRGPEKCQREPEAGTGRKREPLPPFAFATYHHPQTGREDGAALGWFTEHESFGPEPDLWWRLLTENP